MKAAFIAVSLLVTPAASESLPDVSKVVSEIQGREVVAEGEFRLSFDGRMLFSSEGTAYPVEFAVDRRDLKAVSSCAEGSDMLAAALEPGCKATVSAEISVDAGQIGLIVFALTLH